MNNGFLNIKSKTKACKVAAALAENQVLNDFLAQLFDSYLCTSFSMDFYKEWQSIDSLQEDTIYDTPSCRHIVFIYTSESQMAGVTERRVVGTSDHFNNLVSPFWFLNTKTDLTNKKQFILGEDFKELLRKE